MMDTEALLVVLSDLGNQASQADKVFTRQLETPEIVKRPRVGAIFRAR